MAIESTSDLDDYGRNLLHALQEDSRLSYADLGRRVGLSPSATAERMRRMEEDGIIRAYTVEIDREALGPQALGQRHRETFLVLHYKQPHARSIPEVT